MSLLADALQPFLVKDLASVAGRMKIMTLPDSFIEPLAAYDLNFDDTQRAIIVDFRDTNSVAMALAADACRLACAAFQTMTLTSDEMTHRDSMAWSLIKLYYSAFYAGNALIRLLGESCSYFDRQHVSRLNQLAVALNRTPGFRIDGGLYRCVVDQGGTALWCTRARSGVGGAHEAFWDIFGSRLGVLATDILAGPLSTPDAQSVFSQLEQFRDVLKQRINHSWLSVVRNELQYRHEYQVWFPAQLRNRQRETLSRHSTRWSLDPMDIDLSKKGEVLSEFVASCCFVVSMCNTMLARIADRSSVGARSFTRLGPIAFLNDRAA